MTKIDVQQKLGNKIILMYKNIYNAVFIPHDNYIKLYNEIITVVNIEEILNNNFTSIKNNIISEMIITSDTDILEDLICDECNKLSNTFLYILGRKIYDYTNEYSDEYADNYTKFDTVHICENCINKLIIEINNNLCQLNLINPRFKCTGNIFMFSEKYDKFLCENCFRLSLEYCIEGCTERTFDHNTITRITGTKDI